MEHLHTRVAYYYYKGGFTQDEIAKKLNISRQRVNRILGECLKNGIVQINIAGSEKLHYDLEAKIEKAYGLKSVRIIESSVDAGFYNTIGNVAALYLAEILQNGDIIGISRGRAMSALVDAMPHVRLKDLTVTQLMGGWNTQQRSDNVDDIVHRFAEKTNAFASMLYAPVLVRSQQIRDSIMEEAFFKEAYHTLEKCTVAIVGIGTVNNNFPFSDFPTASEDLALWHSLKENADGEICTYFFDRDGSRIHSELENRIIAIKLDDYLKIPHRIGVAGQLEKLPAIKGALKGGFINTLITDYDVAVNLLKEL